MDGSVAIVSAGCPAKYLQALKSTHKQGSRTRRRSEGRPERSADGRHVRTAGARQQREQAVGDGPAKTQTLRNSVLGQGTVRNTGTDAGVTNGKRNYSRVTRGKIDGATTGNLAANERARRPVDLRIIPSLSQNEGDDLAPPSPTSSSTLNTASQW
ncbi:hypothetical protein V8E36_001406 [Tilletia maclaganii]